MSQFPGNGSTTPLSKKPASTGILDTFRSLVKSRSRQSILQSPSGLNVSSPLSVGARDTIDDHVSIDISGQDFPDDDVPLSSGDELRPLREQIIEGPPEIQEMLDRLEDSHHQAARVEAAFAVAAFVKEYPVTAVTAIWAAARDILDDHEVPGAIEAGYCLLTACVRYKTLSPQERMFFFDSISRERNQEDFSLRFDVLVELCSHGRYVESLEPRMVPLLVKLLISRYELAARARRKNKSLKLTTAENQNLIRVFNLIRDVTKFNAKIFTEAHLVLLLHQILAICKSTAIETDINQSVDVLDAIVTYSYIPETVLEDCIKVLCEIYSQVPALEKQIWTAICNLLRSHLGILTLNAITNLLREPTQREDYLSSTVRGAVLILHCILSLSEEESLPKPSMIDVMSALKDAVHVRGTKTIQGIMQLVLDYLLDDDSFYTMTEDGTWTTFGDIVTECARRISKLVVKKETDVMSRNSNVVPDKQGEEQTDTRDDSGLLSKIISSLSSRSRDTESNQKMVILEILMRIVRHVDDSKVQLLIDLHEELNFLTPTNEDWLKHCSRLNESLFEDRNRSAAVRIAVLRNIFDASNLAEALDVPEAHLITMKIFARIGMERDSFVLADLVEHAITITTNSSIQIDMFDAIVCHIESSLLSADDIPSKATTAIDDNLNSPEKSVGSIFADCLVIMFLRSLNKSTAKTIRLYSVLIQVCKSDAAPIDARLRVLKLLLHLRSDINHSIYVVPTIDGENLAFDSCRTSRLGTIDPEMMEIGPSQQMRTEDQSKSWKAKTVYNSAADFTKTTAKKRATTTSSRSNQIPAPTSSSIYPKGFPEEPPTLASGILYSSPPRERIRFLSPNQLRNFRVLDIASWLEVASSVLCAAIPVQDGIEKNSDVQLVDMSQPQWEVYSLIVTHISSQLANRALFTDAIAQMKLLRSLICEQLRLNTFPAPPSWTNLKRTDVAVCLFNILTVLVSYHDHFSKVEEDEIIRVLLLGLGGWERTAECCIHAFSICCYEIPLSISKALESVLQKMSQIITQTQTAVHILEFLAGLARLPDLFKNFREEEFRTVFGMCLRYLQAVRDQQDKFAQPRSRPGHSSARRVLPSLEEHKGKSLTDDLPQYVYVLAYHVMTFWFMSCKIQDRPEKMSWIAKSLIYTNSLGEEIMDEQSQVLIDMMHRVSYSDRDETVANHEFAGPSDGVVAKRNWIVGLSILTIETAGRTGLSQVTFRRPSGTRYSIVKPQLVEPPRHQEPIALGPATESFCIDPLVVVYPESVLQEMYSPFNISPFSGYKDSPILLPDDEATQRALTSFDRTSALDSHKIGIIYVGEAQTSEVSILSNVMGSADYTTFLTGIGTLTRLKNASFNTQGLDRDLDLDGEFTICWRDRVSEIVFHVPTMMPTDAGSDPLCTNKKRHTGNDFVNIIFNNSGLPFAFDTFPSDFNYVNIVITPEARASFIETRLYASTDPGHNPNLFYKVHVQTKSSLPSISPASEPKTVSAKSLPAYVRHLALNASVFSQVWTVRKGGEPASSWRARLREIVKLKEKHALSKPPLDKFSNVIDTNSGNSGLQSTTLSSQALKISGDRERSWDIKSSRRTSVPFLGSANMSTYDPSGQEQLAKDGFS